MFFKPHPIKVSIRANNIVWQYAQDAGTGEWVGVCRALNLNALGDSFEEVQACAIDAMQALLHSLLETGELDAFLRRNGWSVADGMPKPGQRARFDVPYGSALISPKELVAVTA